MRSGTCGTGATAPNRICDACLLRRLCLCPKVSITDTPADIPFRDPLGRGLPRSIIKKMTKKHFPTTALIHLTHEDIANTRFDVTKISLEDYQAISEMIAEKLNDGFVPLVKETIIEFYTYHKQLNS